MEEENKKLNSNKPKKSTAKTQKAEKAKEVKVKKTKKEVAQKPEKAKDNDNIVVSQKYTKEVFNDFANFSNKNNKVLKLIYVCAAIIFVCGIIMFSYREYIDACLDFFLAIVFGCYGLIVKFVTLSLNKKNMNKTDVYIFDLDKFFITNVDENGQETSRAELYYKYLHDVKESDKYLFIYHNKQICYIINKSAFKSQEECANLVNRIKSYIATQNQNQKQTTANKN